MARTGRAGYERTGLWDSPWAPWDACASSTRRFFPSVDLPNGTATGSRQIEPAEVNTETRSHFNPPKNGVFLGNETTEKFEKILGHVY